MTTPINAQMLPAPCPEIPPCDLFVVCWFDGYWSTKRFEIKQDALDYLKQFDFPAVRLFRLNEAGEKLNRDTPQEMDAKGTEAGSSAKPACGSPVSSLAWCGLVGDEGAKIQQRGAEFSVELHSSGFVTGFMKASGTGLIALRYALDRWDLGRAGENALEVQLEIQRNAVSDARRELGDLRTRLCAAREKALDEVKAMVMGGRFLHDQAPTKLFAQEVCAAVERMKSARVLEERDA